MALLSHIPSCVSRKLKPGRNDGEPAEGLKPALRLERRGQHGQDKNNHALRAGAMSKDQVYAELADLAAGRKRGRMTEDELVIFDSSGSGVQDVAAAWVAYREGRRTGIGAGFGFSGPGPEQVK